jgi:hypothetical protein
VGPLGGKWRPSVGKVRKWYVESRHLHGCSPRLSWLRTDGLSPRVSIERTDRMLIFMGPASLIAGYQQMSAFLHCFIGWLRREAGYGTTDRSAGVLWIVSEALFLGSSDYVQRCRRLVKGCYALNAWDTYGIEPYVDWAWKAYGVLVRFSPAAYTSIRITATLRYE